MTQLFSIVFPIAGTVSPLGVETFDGFDLPQTSTLVPILSDGSSTGNQVLQQGATPFLQAQVAGWLIEPEHVATLRAAYASKEAGTFTDGNGNSLDVRIFDLPPIKDRTDWWEWTMTLIESDTPALGALLLEDGGHLLLEDGGLLLL